MLVSEQHNSCGKAAAVLVLISTSILKKNVLFYYKIEGGVCMADDSDEIVQKNNLLEILNDISTHEDRLEELVELIEGQKAVECYPDMDQYHIFCQAYTIKLLQKYVISKDEREILLALYRLLEGYEDFETVKALHEHYAKKAFGYNKQIKVWKDPDSSLSKKEAKIIEKLAERLIKVITDNSDSKKKGWLNLADTVVQELSRQFPDGLPKKYPLPHPSYQEQDYSKKKEQPDSTDPPLNPQGFRIHIGGISIGSLININKKAQVSTNFSWVKYSTCFILVVIVVVIWGGFFRPQTSPESEFPSVEATPSPVEEIFPTEKEIILVPGDERPLKVGVIFEEDENAPLHFVNVPLNFVSSDPSIVTVSHTGVLKACEDPETRGRPYQTVDITIQAESGVTKIKTVVVNFAGIDTPKTSAEVEAGFYVWPQIRLAGTKEWSDTVNAEIGDIVEIQIQYRNIGESKQENVMVRDVMPKSLRYVEGTTKLWTAGASGMVLPETIATTGVNIGHFTSNSNAYIRFQAEVVEDGLACGHNTLKNWAQVGVSGVTLQNATAVYVNKDG